MKNPIKLFSQELDKAKKNSSTGLGSPLEVFFSSLAIFFISQIVAGLIASLIFSFNSNKDFVDLFEKAGPQFVFVLIAEALAVGMVYWLVVKFKKAKLSSIGLGRKPVWADLKNALLGFGAYYVILIIVLGIASWLVPAINLDQEQNIGFENIKSSYDQLFAFASLVILAPIGEEVVMRGYLYSGLRAKMKYLPSMLITSLVFAVAHLEFGTGKSLVWAAALTTFILSIVLVRQREKTGAIYAGVLIHMLNNLVAFIVIF